MKKIVLILITVLCFVMCMSLSSSAAEYKDFEYQVLKNGKIAVTRYKGNDEEVTIPSEIKNKTVVSLGKLDFTDEDVFDWEGNTKVVHIPSTINDIDFFAFRNNIFI